MDVDGTLTDGKIYMGPNGEMMKAFDIKDGYGIHDMLIPHRITPVVITGRDSQIVYMRCKELGVNSLFQGVKDKAEVLINLLIKEGANFSEVAYIGDDLNDLNCMNKVLSGGGLVGCPADAVKDVKAIASYVSENNGGNGAVRDFIEYIIKNNLCLSL